jgi:hypothetical protein
MNEAKKLPDLKVGSVEKIPKNSDLIREELYEF